MLGTGRVGSVDKPPSPQDYRPDLPAPQTNYMRIPTRYYTRLGRLLNKVAAHLDIWAFKLRVRAVANDSPTLSTYEDNVIYLPHLAPGAITSTGRPPYRSYHSWPPGIDIRPAPIYSPPQPTYIRVKELPQDSNSFVYYDPDDDPLG